LSEIVRAVYEGGVLRPLKSLKLREGEVVRVRIERSLREKLRDLIGVLGESSEEELERYLGEAWRS
jgi:predicted DNA-binding antitoxin AbrB/MazE fold protein